MISYLVYHLVLDFDRLISSIEIWNLFCTQNGKKTLPPFNSLIIIVK